MRQGIIIASICILFVLSGAITTAALVLPKCHTPFNGKFFELKTIDTVAATKYFETKITDYDNGVKATLYHHVCTQIQSTNMPSTKCKYDESTTYLVVGEGENEKCYSLSSSYSSKTPTTWTSDYKDSIYYLKADNSNLEKAIYPKSLEYQLKCNPKVGFSDTLSWSAKTTADKIIVSADTRIACGYAWGDFIEILRGYKWYVAPGLLIFGLIVCLIGHRIFRVALFVSGFILGYPKFNTLDLHSFVDSCMSLEASKENLPQYLLSSL